MSRGKSEENLERYVPSTRSQAVKGAPKNWAPSHLNHTQIKAKLPALQLMDIECFGWYYLTTQFLHRLIYKQQ